MPRVSYIHIFIVVRELQKLVFEILEFYSIKRNNTNDCTNNNGI